MALVGVGRWGINHLRLLAERHDREDGVELVAAVDTCAAARDRAAALRPGMRVAGELSEVLGERVDALIVATPPATHAALARRALEAGKHVLVEKPLCTSAVDAVELEGLARAAERVLHTGHVVLHHPGYAALFERSAQVPPEELDAEREGALRGPIDPVEVLWSLGPHDLAVALRIHGPLLRVASARATHDGVRVHLRSPAGDRAQIELRRVGTPSVRRCRVRFRTGEVMGVDELVEAAPQPDERPLARQLDAFARAIRGGGAPTTDEGPRVVELLTTAAALLDREPTLAVERVNLEPHASIEAVLPMAASGSPG